MAITKRLVKGSKLTHAELDANFTDLDNNKLNKSSYAANNTMVIKDSSGNIVSVAVPVNSFLGRIATGEIKAMTVAEAKTLLNIDISDILTAAPGWGVPTGTASRTTFATGSVSTTQLAEKMKALIDDLTALGIIGL